MTALAAILKTERFSAEGAAPLYLRLQAAIREAVAAGTLSLGDALPPERELAAELGISRVTVRKALAGLVGDGLLTQRRGSGTYVTSPPRRVEQPLSRLTSFSDDMRTRGFVPTVRILERTVSLPTPEEAMTFGLKTGEQVSRLNRLRLADGVPMAIELASVPAIYLPDPALVDGSLYLTLEAKGIRPVRALQRLSAANLGAADAALLDVSPGSAALRIERISYLGDGRVVEFTRSFYRGDAYDFVAELNLGAGP